jgi:hypothetical protein
MATSQVTKICTRCNSELPLSEFATNRWGKHGKQAACRACTSARAKESYKQPATLSRRKTTQARWYVENKDRVSKMKAEAYQNQRARYLVWQASRRAKRKGVSFSLAQTDVVDLQRRIDAGFCEVTGTPFDLEVDKFNSPSLDRIDSSKGYSPDNVRVVCAALNYAMHDWGANPVWEMVQHWLRKKASEAKGS